MSAGGFQQQPACRCFVSRPQVRQGLQLPWRAVCVLSVLTPCPASCHTMGLLPELRATDVIFLHCPTCAFQTHFLSRLGEHFEQSHSGSVEFRLYRCPVCQRVASSLPFMREHLDVMHEAETGTDIAVYFSGNLYSQQKEEEGAKEERSCAFCAFKAADADLAEHYGIVHGVANVFFDRVCDDPAPASLLEAKAESGDEVSLLTCDRLSRSIILGCQFSCNRLNM